MTILELNPSFVQCYDSFSSIREFVNTCPHKLPQALVELKKGQAFMVFYILGVLNVNSN